MLTGKFPREADVTRQLEAKGIPQDLVRVIRRCLEYERKRRFQDVMTLRIALLEARLSTPARMVLSPARLLLGSRVYDRVLKQLAGLVPPLWRRREFWFLPFGFAVLVLGVWWFQPNEPVEITIANSSAKKDFIAQAVEAFNEASQSDGRFQIHESLGLQRKPLVVRLIKEELEPGVRDDYRSGTMIRHLLNTQTGGSPQIRPVIASPAELSWIVSLKEEWIGPMITTGEALGVAHTPFAIAMWRSRAAALGCWPTAGPECTWTQLGKLASSPDGWGRLGHPEWGRLKFGAGIPGKSNSGTLLQVFSCISGLKESALLLPGEVGLEDIRLDNGCGQAIAGFDRALTVTLEKSDEVLTEMRKGGPAFLDAAATNEHEVFKLNQNYGVLLPEPVVAVYPQDGTIMNTHPFAVLDGAPWVRAEQVRAAIIFREFLLTPEQQAKLAMHGFRPANPVGVATEAEREQWRRWGANLDANLAIVELPSPQIITAIINIWESVRTPR
jgi:hypothetical protein